MKRGIRIVAGYLNLKKAYGSLRAQPDYGASGDISEEITKRLKETKEILTKGEKH